ncbi:MAG TPA: cytochrome c nitrite reductase small subunit [Clostridia bacterium]|nr:cytochrome c nitrite reductase small subunit [Clostridia bacterium]
MRSGTSAVVLGVLVGVVIGLGLYTFVYAKGYSYLTNDPEACANCHVMEEYYSGWIKSSHRSVANCNDCHTPHNFLGKYAIKATNGFFHSLAFTTGRYPDNILIKGYNHRVAEGTCKRCHAELTFSILGVHNGRDISCITCHFNVGHSAPPFSFTSVSPTLSPMGSPTGEPSIEENNNGREQR